MIHFQIKCGYCVDVILIFPEFKTVMHIHIAGICGTFMGGIALLARELGYQVSGSDINVYPPMSTQLQSRGIELREGYEPEHLDPEPDIIIIGNALSRGNPLVEYVLERGLLYTSGPQWLAEHVLQDCWVLGVAGTHGKTTTSSMLAWILEDAGLSPGFLIGGVPQNFGVSARLGAKPFFIVEADEYDTAFFDKRSKFVHYHPRTLIINNLEFDHADIFPDLGAIQRQFHHLIRTVPGNGLILVPANDNNIDAVIDQGCWTPLETFSAIGNADWTADISTADGGRFDVDFDSTCQGKVEWGLMGEHNINNALAAIATARHAGVPPQYAINALTHFQNVKRRMEKRASINGIIIYDDFAHHPTAIATTLAGLRARAGDQRIIAVLELRSNTMRMGVHKNKLASALILADHVLLFQPDEMEWDLTEIVQTLGTHAKVYTDIVELVASVTQLARPGDQVLIMSNGAFGDIHNKLQLALRVD